MFEWLTIRSRSKTENEVREIEMTPGWTFFGIVEGRTEWKTPEGDEIAYTDVARWVLAIHEDGRRRARVIGTPGTSHFAIAQEAAVEGWLVGGPLPRLVGDAPVVTKPKKKQADLLVFPGGKVDEQEIK